MVLILSENLDESVNYVIDYLIEYKIPFIRVNSQTIIDEIIVDNLNDILLKFNDITLNINQITVIWYHRGNLNFNFENIKISKYIEHVKNEWNELKSYVMIKLFQKNHLGSYFNRHVNKLYVLDMAKNSGLKVPDSHVFLNYSSLSNILISEKLITKSIGSLYNDSNKNKTEVGYTSKVCIKDLEIKKNYFPILIQNEIKKKFEVRTFYIEGEFYSCAIFSQRYEHTSIDYRNFGIEPNFKCVPYKLPNDVEGNLDNLMCKLNIDIGSIDLIVDLSGNHVFLEINPFGQFGMFLEYANINLPYIIANKLKAKFEKVSKY